MVNKLRTTILIVFVAYIAFIVGGLSLVGLVDDSPAAVLMKTDAALSSAWMTIAVASVIALLAVVAGGMPLAVTLIQRALTTSRRTLRLLLVPPVSFMVLALYGLFMASLAFGWLHIPGIVQIVSPDHFPLGNRLLLGGLMLVFVLGAIASTAAVWKAVSGLNRGSRRSTGWRAPEFAQGISIRLWAGGCHRPGHAGDAGRHARLRLAGPFRPAGLVRFEPGAAADEYQLILRHDRYDHGPFQRLWLSLGCCAVFRPAR